MANPSDFLYNETEILQVPSATAVFAGKSAPSTTEPKLLAYLMSCDLDLANGIACRWAQQQQRKTKTFISQRSLKSGIILV